MGDSGFAIRPMTVGAEITGLAQGAERDPEVAAQLRAVWLEHGVLLFRGVDSIDYHLSLSAVFGELEVHQYEEVRSALHPLLVEIGGSKRPPAYVYDDARLRINCIPWHRDTIFTPDTCKGAMLRMVTPTVEEGETLLADTARAYEALPEAMKQRLDKLEYKAQLEIDPMEQTGPGALWRTVRRATPQEDPETGPMLSHDPATRDLYPPVVQPAVLRHPTTGRKCLFLSPTYQHHFLGLDQAESDALLRALTDHMLQPQFIHRHKWAANDAIIWDNFRFMHAATGHRIDDTRFALRTTLAGPVRTGRYFDRDAAAKTPDFAD